MCRASVGCVCGPRDKGQLIVTHDNVPHDKRTTDYDPTYLTWKLIVTYDNIPRDKGQLIVTCGNVPCDKGQLTVTCDNVLFEDYELNSYLKAISVPITKSQETFSAIVGIRTTKLSF